MTLVHSLWNKKWDFDAKKISNIKILIISLIIGLMGNIVVMNIPFCLILHPLDYFGYDYNVGLSVMYYVFLLIVAIDLLSKKVVLRKKILKDWPLLLSMIVYIVVSLFMAKNFESSSVKSTSQWQAYGDCDTIEDSFWGAFQRRKYVCSD